MGRRGLGSPTFILLLSYIVVLFELQEGRTESLQVKNGGKNKSIPTESKFCSEFSVGTELPGAARSMGFSAKSQILGFQFALLASESVEFKASHFNILLIKELTWTKKIF